MHLTTFADLGLRTLMILGDLDEGQRVTISDLAKTINASANHVAKVNARLVELGWVTAVRGRNGGVHLADGTRQASVGKILRQLEGPGEVVDCEGGARCPLLYRDCALRRRLAAAREAFFAELDGDTIGDLIVNTLPAGSGGKETPHHLGLPHVPGRSTATA